MYSIYPPHLSTTPSYAMCAHAALTTHVYLHVRCIIELVLELDVGKVHQVHKLMYVCMI